MSEAAGLRAAVEALCEKPLYRLVMTGAYTARDEAVVRVSDLRALLAAHPASVVIADEEHYDWCKGICGGSCGRSKRNLAAPVPDQDQP